MQNFYLSLDLEEKNVLTLLLVSFQHKMFNTQNWPNSNQCIDKFN